MAVKGLFDFLKSDRTPFCAHFAVPAGFSFPADFKTSAYPGLALCHLLATSLVTYWRDEASYRAYQAALATALGLPAADRSGVVTFIKHEKNHWWEPKSISAVLLALAAAFGAISVIRDYFADLFAFPDVTLAYADAGHVDAVEGDQVSIPVTALSGVRFAPETVRFDAPVLQPRPGASSPWTFDAGTIPALSAAQPQKVSVIGTAPPHSGKQGAADIYGLSLTSRAKAGLVTGLVLKGRAAAPPKEVWVWSSKPGLSRPRVGRAQGTSCEFLGELYSPRAYPLGLSLEVDVVAAARQITAVNAAAPGGMGVRPDISPDGTAFIAGIRWPALDKFRVYPYRIFLDAAQPVSRSSCQQWIGKMRVGVK